MGIYDPILQAYQGGIDRQLALRQQQPSLVDAILKGYGQGREWQQQDWQRGMAERQFAEQQRHTGEQERLQAYGIDQKAQTAEANRQAKARLEGEKNAIKMTIEARQAEFSRRAADARDRRDEKQAVLWEKQAEFLESKKTELENSFTHRMNLLDAQTARLWEYRPMSESGIMGLGSVGQERDLMQLLGRVYSGEITQRGQALATPGGKIGSLESAPQNVDMGDAIQQILSRLDDLKKLRGSGAPAVNKFKKVGGQRNEPGTAPVPVPPPAPPAAPTQDEVPPAPWE